MRGLRNAILRTPLGLSLDHEDPEPERDQMHFGLFDTRGELLACVIAAPLTPHEARIRQMAVAKEHQGRGWGRTLLQTVERELAQRGFTRLVMHARLEAEGFYGKLGYTRRGAVFTEVTLPHIHMQKSLSPPA
jgi:predicted GNAT family N-acyltransferase